jgi:5-methyltetrahydrofolate--homocysteine methyltransferase
VNPRTEPALSAPFWGGRILDHVAPEDLLPFLDRPALFRKRWQLRTDGSERFHELWTAANRQLLWQPKVVFGYFRARLISDCLFLHIPATRDRHVGFCFSAALARSVRARHHEVPFVVALQLVTLGRRVAARGRELGLRREILDQFLLHGLAAELTEALAEYCQQTVMESIGWRKTRRLSPGYPAWPDLGDQRGVFLLLKPGRIGVRLTLGFQMVPEYSTGAILLPMASGG